MRLAECSSLQWQDALTLLCDGLIGEGISRQVYACKLNADYVVKMTIDCERFQNQREWAVWNAVRDVRRIHSWFAPCTAISEAGLWMTQRRTQPVDLQWLRKKHPRVPELFTDFKVGNWGLLEGRLVCHDYGTALTTECGLTTKTKKADWWE